PRLCPDAAGFGVSADHFALEGAIRMKNTRYFQAAMAIVIAVAAVGSADAQRRPPTPPSYDAFYELGPDSLVRRGVPKGKVEGPFKLPTEVFPGTQHDYWIYVPAQYDGETEV